MHWISWQEWFSVVNGTHLTYWKHCTARNFLGGLKKLQCVIFAPVISGLIYTYAVHIENSEHKIIFVCVTACISCTKELSQELRTNPIL